MTARVLTFERHAGRGRQPAIVEELRDARDELAALIDEGRLLGEQLVAIARMAQIRVVRGGSPASALDEIERLALRHLTRMTAAGVSAREGARCPDSDAIAGHGAAA